MFLCVSILYIFVFVCLLIVCWKGYHFLYIWWFTESKWSCSFKRSIYYMTFDFYMIVFLDQYETLSSPQVRVTSLLLCKMAQFGEIYDVSAINLSCISISIEWIFCKRAVPQLCNLGYSFKLSRAVLRWRKCC